MNKTVLIVDDEAEIVSLTSAFLAKRGYRALQACNGKLALELLHTVRPDLIITDVTMPEVDGFQFYKKLKMDPKMLDIPVLIITGRGGMEDAFRVIGVDDFLRKPFSPEALLEKIEKILAGKGVAGAVVLEQCFSKGHKILIFGKKDAASSKMCQLAHSMAIEADIALSDNDAICKAVAMQPQLVFVDILLDESQIVNFIDYARKLLSTQSLVIVGYSYRSGRADKTMDDLAVISKSAKYLQLGFSKYLGDFSEKEFINILLDVVKSSKTEV